MTRLIAVAVGALALAVWLWPTKEGLLEASDDQIGGQNLVSAIQPINDADALTLPDKLPEVTTTAALSEPDSQDQIEFNQAVDAIQRGDYARADQLLGALITRQPGLLEPYINLASAKAAMGDLNAAREILNDGLNANQNYGALYKNLQKVHAALAADAYQAALTETGTGSGTEAKRLELPVVTNLNGSVSPVDPSVLTEAQTQIAKLRTELEAKQASLADQQKQLAAVNSDLQSRQQAITDLQSQLSAAQSVASETSQASQIANTEIANLQSQLSAAQSIASETNQASRIANTEIANLQSKLAKAEQEIADLQTNYTSEVASLREQLRQQQEQLASQELLAQQEQDKLTSQIAALSSASRPEPVAIQSAPVVDTVATAEVPSSTASVISPNAKELAIDQVKAWASAWSDQNVAAYVSHYREGYTPPGSAISHSEWRAQRQVRLTNKRFIEVTLSDFNTREENGQLAISFVQRYRSNTMDDTIRKQLKLSAPNGDWGDARIVSEKVLR